MVMVMTKNRSYFKTTDKSMSKRCWPKSRRYVWTTTCCKVNFEKSWNHDVWTTIVIFWEIMHTRSASLINNYILWTGRRPNLEQFVILLLNGFTNLPLWSFESKTRFFLLFSDNPAFAIIPPSTYPDLDPCSRGPQHKKNRPAPVPRSLKGGLCKVELNNNTFTIMVIPGYIENLQSCDLKFWISPSMVILPVFAFNVSSILCHSPGNILWWLQNKFQRHQNFMPLITEEIPSDKGRPELLARNLTLKFMVHQSVI